MGYLGSEREWQMVGYCLVVVGLLALYGAGSLVWAIIKAVFF